MREVYVVRLLARLALGVVLLARELAPRHHAELAVGAVPHKSATTLNVKSKEDLDATPRIAGVQMGTSFPCVVYLFSLNGCPVMNSLI